MERNKKQKKSAQKKRKKNSKAALCRVLKWLVSCEKKREKLLSSQKAKDLV